MKGPTLLMWRFFVKTVETGSLSSAAAFFKTDPGFVSRQLKALDESLGVTLLERSKSGAKPTWEGSMRYLEAKEAVKIADSLYVPEKEAPENIRMAVPISLSSLFTKWAGSFSGMLGGHCRVEIMPYSQSAPLDIMGFDCYVCEKNLPNARVIAKRLGFVEKAVIASSTLLASQKPIRGPEDLAGRTLIASYSGYCQFNSRRQSCSVWVDPAVRIEADSALVASAREGTGIALGVPLWQVFDDLKTGRLINALPEWEISPTPVWILRQPRAEHTPLIKKLQAYILEMWAKTPGLSVRKEVPQVTSIEF